MELKGKAALITGGTRGIGAATAIELAKQGADVAICAREIGQAAEEVKSKIEALRQKCFITAADLSRPEEAERFVSEAAEALGSVDILVHSAGGPAPGRLLDIDPADWNRAFDIHVHAGFYLSRAVVPHMRKAGEGAIILVGSVAGIRGVANILAYGTVKGAVSQFTRMLAMELADDNIRVNCVEPGIIRTRFHENMTEEQKKNNLDNRVPLHREGHPDDVAQAIALLAKNEFMAGACVVIDGGMSMRIA